jgi:hypothetical protein
VFEGCNVINYFYVIMSECAFSAVMYLSFLTSLFSNNPK